MSALYFLFALLGLMSVFGSLIYGFHYDAAAPVENYIYNVALYGIWVFVHILMVLPFFKRMVYGSPKSSGIERRVFITVSTLTWWAVYYLHQPVPGPALELGYWAGFAGVCLSLLGFFAFLEGFTFGALRAFVGVDAEALSHSADDVAPLNMAGSYARVRHPMYQGAMIAGVGGLLIHPHMGQLMWTAMIGLTFLLFIPYEESQLLKRRGEEYRVYMKNVKYRVFPYIW
ncbi:hypothetical protein [Emcibacter sp.]|uniref:methyltransferase family protein n=1 Tax=Emcibacter sp. TaxID=1979954 RepID=UPI002AA7CB21|nr:hypothetical protein [Emcibacter sp.]